MLNAEKIKAIIASTFQRKLTDLYDVQLINRTIGIKLDTLILISGVYYRPLGAGRNVNYS